VKEQNNKLFTFASLSDRPFKERLIIRLAGVLFHRAISIIGGLTNVEVQGDENRDVIVKAGKAPIYAYWHDRMFLTTYFLRHRGVTFLTSRSFDGEYLARVYKRFGYGVIRGSSSQGGSEALAALAETMNLGNAVLLTVDGPRGPRYVSKIGAVILAKRTGNPVLPIIIEAARYRTFKSWDRLQLPIPFSQAVVIFGDPIYVGEDAGPDEIEMKHRELQSSLDALVERGREWRESR
jgi:lysophospholipid acyltransferase (LPLAT)-like uncharacterized protein